MSKIVVTENDKEVASATKTKLKDVLIDAARAGLKVVGEAITNLKVADKSVETQEKDNAN